MRLIAAAAALTLGLVWLPLRAGAIPVFSHQYDVTCQKCHTVVPHLNDFGAHFLANGERIPGVDPSRAFPISLRLNLVDSSENQGDGPNGAGLPKAIVDEIELLSAGVVGSRADYFVEQYAVDGGQIGLVRDAWINERLNPWSDHVPLYVQAGQFTLPLPVDPETFRESYAGYDLYGQTVGDNPFNFFDPKIGAKVSLGDTLRGANVQIFAGPGHDRQSGLRTTGTDVMAYAQQVLGPFTLSGYNFQGTRPDIGTALDRFERTGLGLVFNERKWSWDSVVQGGRDSQTAGAAASSNGGFTQVRYAPSPRFFALARYEGTNDPSGFVRDGVLMLGYGPSHASRLSIEDVIAHSPATTNTVNLQLTVAF